jgi:DNA-directed RNA polymerase specialized sigma24 family protein
MDFNDVEQKLRLHIFKKWEKWNPEMALLPWLNTVITNQIINLVRNNYSNYARPCLNCPHNAGGNNCKLYNVQSSKCADYAKWEKTKKHAYDVKLPVSVNDERIFGEGNEFDARASDSSGFDFESFVPKVHSEMLKSLTPVQQKVYTYLFVDGYPETEVITMLGYKNGSTKTGYKFVKKIRAQIVIKAKKIVKEMII